MQGRAYRRTERMKRIWKIRKDDEAVSPVIATILMVAITVVLAAVLYVMVIGFGGGGSQAPPGNFSPITVTSSTTATLTFGTFNPVPKPMDIKVIITPTGGTQTEFSFPTAPTTATTIMTSSTSGVGANYTDMNYQGNAVNSGDYVNVWGLSPSTTYTISVYHFPSDSLCPLTGQTTFNTPA
jgi:flagellin-like protein